MPARRPWSGTRVLSIANLKGGVGKSTTAMMIADTLALHHNVRVLAFDLDPQSNLSRMFLGYQGLKRADDAKCTLTNWVGSAATGAPPLMSGMITTNVCGLKEVADRRRVGGPHPHGDVAVIAATPQLRFAEMDFDYERYAPGDRAAPRKHMTGQLSAGLRTMGEAFDLVLFDCPPGFTTLAQASLAISDAIISPMLEEPLSVWSLQSFRDFGLNQTLGAWSPDRHRGMYTRVRAQGAIEERRKVREAVVAAGFTTLRTSVKEAAEAQRWIRRPGTNSVTPFNKKYGPVRAAVQALGDEVVTFISALPPR